VEWSYGAFQRLRVKTGFRACCYTPSNLKKCIRTHQTAPFSGGNSKKILGRGHSPLSRPLPHWSGDTNMLLHVELSIYCCTCTLDNIKCKRLGADRPVFMPVLRTERIGAYGASVVTPTAFAPPPSISTLPAVARCLSVCLFVCHTPVFCRNDSIYHQTFFIVG